MSKRAANDDTSPAARKNLSREDNDNEPSFPAEMGEFEDQYGDDLSDEDEVIVAGYDGEDPGEDETMEDTMELDKGVYLPSRHKLQPGEILEPDSSAYHMLHRMNVKWPCLSFDILNDDLGDERRIYPHTVYMVAGTQAERPRDNEIIIMKLSGLHKERQQNEDSDEEDDDSDTEDEPILESRSIPTTSTTNRLRLSPHTHTAATMVESGDLYIWDVSSQYYSFDRPGTVIPPSAKKPQATLKIHGRTEGYALDWSPHPKENMGKIASGDNDGRIFISTQKEGGSWATSKDPFRGHTGSIEELQWSPSERHVFASASSDGTVKIWDARAPNMKHQLSVEVSSSDVNVASWCRSVDYLLATGADDGVWGVWDLRTFPSTAQGKTITASASFTFHQEPITSVEFHPSEDSVVAVACADNTVTQWDLGVEFDDEESRDTSGVADVPAQLMFVHHMPEVKEVHWQKQAPSVVVATGGEGFNVFKTISA
ncbi:WD40-repeat-containing domain protein [Trichophaea hybrida]|nr:WD40-repeat-containing domain protein [Trichophaea hybrida]